MATVQANPLFPNLVMAGTSTRSACPRAGAEGPPKKARVSSQEEMDLGAINIPERRSNFGTAGVTLPEQDNELRDFAKTMRDASNTLSKPQ